MKKLIQSIRPQELLGPDPNARCIRSLQYVICSLRSYAQVALAWLLHQPGVTSPIIGASKMYQLEEAVTALSIQLSKEDCTYLEERYQPHRVLGHS